MKRKKEFSADYFRCQVRKMNTSNYELTDHHTPQTPIERFKKPLIDRTNENDDSQFGLTSATPLGQLLKLIGSLPEIRHEKVQSVRGQIDHGRYDVSTNLDAALDKVLEEFLTEG